MHEAYQQQAAAAAATFTRLHTHLPASSTLRHKKCVIPYILRCQHCTGAQQPNVSGACRTDARGGTRGRARFGRVATNSQSASGHQQAAHPDLPGMHTQPLCMCNLTARSLHYMTMLCCPASPSDEHFQPAPSMLQYHVCHDELRRAILSAAMIAHL